MRNFFAVIIMAMVSFSFVLFSPDMAEAAKRRCTCYQGTAVRGCPMHGNDCLGLSAHEHENTKGRRANLPTFCEVDGQRFLVNDYSCKNLRKQIRNQERAQRKALRKHERAQRRAEGERERALRDSPLGIFQERVEHNSRRLQRDINRDIERSIERRVDEWFGYR